LRSSLIGGFEVSEQEVSDLVAFLNALTDSTLIRNPKHADPWRKLGSAGVNEQRHLP
jgi:cytochrome c peroxidase